MNAFCLRAVGCFLSVVMCFGGACASESVGDAAAGQDSSGQLGGTVSVIAQVERSNVRTFLPASLGPSTDGEPQFRMVPTAYVQQGAAFAVSAINVTPNQVHNCDTTAPERACTMQGWVHVVPMFEDVAQLVASPSYAGGFWLRAEDVILVQVSAPLLASAETGRILDVVQAREILAGVTSLSASRGTPLGTFARPRHAVVYSAPGADGVLRQQNRNDHQDLNDLDLTVGASLDVNDATIGWVVRGADGYLLQTDATLCGKLSGPRCDGWVGLDGSDNAPLVAGVSGWVWFWGAVIAVGIGLAILLIRWQNSKNPPTITVADATGVPPVFDPTATVTPGPTSSPAPLPTAAPPPPPPGAVPEMRCWPAENLRCRYTLYQGVWYCLCLRPHAVTPKTDEPGMECAPLNFWPGTWEDGCAIPGRDISTMGNACWFPDECFADASFNNDL